MSSPPKLCLIALLSWSSVALGQGPGGAGPDTTARIRQNDALLKKDRITEARPKEPLTGVAKPQGTVRIDADALADDVAAMKPSTTVDTERKENFLRALRELRKCTTCMTVEGSGSVFGSSPLTATTHRPGTGRAGGDKLCASQRRYYDTVTERCLSKDDVARE